MIKNQNNNPPPLHGRGILLTRPLAQITNIRTLLQEKGARVEHWPALEIISLITAEKYQQLKLDLLKADIVLVTSSNAVQAIQPFLQTDPIAWPANTEFASIGHATALQMQQLWKVKSILYPTEDQHINSRGLVQLLAKKSLVGKKIIILTGANSTAELATLLAEQAAQISIVPCYQRKPNLDNPKTVLQIWQQGKIDLLVSYSLESLQETCARLMENQHFHLPPIDLMVIKQSMLEYARNFPHFASIHVANSALDQALLKAILFWAENKTP